MTFRLSEAHELARTHPEAVVQAPWVPSTFGLEGPQAYAFLLGPPEWAEGLQEGLVPMDPTLLVVAKAPPHVITVHHGLNARDVAAGMMPIGVWPGRTSTPLEDALDTSLEGY